MEISAELKILQTSHSFLYDHHCILLNRFCLKFTGVNEVVQRKLVVVLCLGFWLHGVIRWRLFRKCNWLLLCCFYPFVSKHYQHGSSNIVLTLLENMTLDLSSKLIISSALFSPDGYITTCLWFQSFVDLYLDKIHVLS